MAVGQEGHVGGQGVEQRDWKPEISVGLNGQPLLGSSLLKCGDQGPFAASSDFP